MSSFGAVDLIAHILSQLSLRISVQFSQNLVVSYVWNASGQSQFISWLHAVNVIRYNNRYSTKQKMNRLNVKLCSCFVSSVFLAGRLMVLLTNIKTVSVNM
jgi:hypothetical protein